VYAICINQTDIAEKSRQLGMMGEIYRRYSHMAIWLGCSNDAGEKDQDSFTFLRHFANNEYIYSLSEFLRDESGVVAYQSNSSFDEPCGRF
jgi:hypothetical protein